LRRERGKISLETDSRDVFLYHLRVLQILKRAQQEGDVRTYHFPLLRQILENISSFLGSGKISYVLRHIGIEDVEEMSQIVNALAHKDVYYNNSDLPSEDHLAMFDEILQKLYSKYPFHTH